MMLIEADAKRLLDEAGLAVPAARMLLDEDAAVPSAQRGVAIKAQLLAGGRGKAGLVRLAGPDDMAAAIDDVRATMRAAGHRPLVMVEEQVAFTAEYYLAWRIDDVRRAAVLMFSRAGGIEVEDHADAIRELAVEPLAPVRQAAIGAFLAECGLRGRVLSAVARFALDLHAVFVREDALLIEINPLAVTPGGGVVALDAKMTLDENAGRRHRSWRALASHHLQAGSADPIEREAAAKGITFVRLDGPVALVSGGAGVGMTLVDLLADIGTPAANFVDLPGGSDAGMFGDLVRLVLRRAEDPTVKALLVFFTLSATSIKQPVESILAALDAAKTLPPVVIGLVAGGSAEREMTLAEAQAAFRARGHACVDDLDAAVSAVARLIAAAMPR